MWLATIAVEAGPARRYQRQDNTIPCLQTADFRPDLDDDTSSFVAKHNRQWFWDHPLPHMQVAGTNTCRLHTHQDLALPWRIQRYLLDDGGLSSFVEYCSFGFHASTSPSGFSDSRKDSL